jgi:hypothetical protein
MSQPTKPASGPLGGERPVLHSDAAAAASEKPCPECGEMVRAGMVRCWNCGAFLKQEIAQKFAEMQAKSAPIELAELPADAVIAVGSADDDDDDDDGGYELRMPIDEPAVKPPERSTAVDDKGEKAEKKPAAAPESKPVRAPASGEDALLQVALSEEAEQKKRRKERGISLRGGARTPGGFVIYCPYGCRMEVKDQHRGMTGRCPKCRAPFIVPVDPPDYDFRERETAVAAEAASQSPTGLWTPWLQDLRLHVVAPEKLKLKPGSLEKDFTEVDAGFSAEGLMVVTLAAKKSGGLFGGGGGDKAKEPARQALFAHLKEGKPAKEAPAGEVRLYTPEECAQVRVAQPAPNPVESMFAGVPVFGEKRIALQLPLREGQQPLFLSFALTGYREFTRALAAAANTLELRAPGVPSTDEYFEFKCHYSDVPIHSLQHVAWYQADPKCDVVLAGWKCMACGLTISEESRKKENIGGKGGKSIAKAKCPKCTNKFGEQPLYTLRSRLASVSMTDSK